MWFSARSPFQRKQTCPCLLDSFPSKYPGLLLLYLCNNWVSSTQSASTATTPPLLHCMPAACQDTDSLKDAMDSPVEGCKHEVHGMKNAISHQISWENSSDRWCISQLSRGTFTSDSLHLLLRLHGQRVCQTSDYTKIRRAHAQTCSEYHDFHWMIDAGHAIIWTNLCVKLQCLAKLWEEQQIPVMVFQGEIAIVGLVAVLHKLSDAC